VGETRRKRLFAALLSSLIAAAAVAAAPAAASAAASHPRPEPVVVVRAGSGSSGAAQPLPSAAQPLPGDERRVCPVAASPGQMECQSVYQLAGRYRGAPAFGPATARVPGFGPASLRAAYGLTRAAATKGRDETIAIVDAYRDPNAARDLASYRSEYHLGSCKTSSGCLRIVNQRGKSGPLPKANAGWAVEESLDLDMVSAICSRCHILLVEASSPSTPSLGAAENAAVAAGARFVSNSWSGTEFPGQWAYNHYFNHPGDAIVFAAGDAGYGTVYPADLQYVTAVGGTTLRHVPAGSRSWTETVWGSANPAVTGGTGSGCAPQTAKPSWQRKPVDIAANGCGTRTENDVAAVANPATGVAVYDTYRTHGTWTELGGTSAATPIITAVYALAGYPARRSYPASYLYQHPARFHDVTSGLNGVCPAARAYLCHGEVGYDGPTGVGTPSGTYGFSRRGTNPVTVVDPGAKSTTGGAAFSLTITGLNTRTAASSLAYTATGLPPGLAIRRVADSDNGAVTGTVSASITAGTVFQVVVTATDTGAHAHGVTRFTITVS
jgi:subtilase family serine protease